jgi:hypothetical protein
MRCAPKPLKPPHCRAFTHWRERAKVVALSAGIIDPDLALPCSARKSSMTPRASRRTLPTWEGTQERQAATVRHPGSQRSRRCARASSGATNPGAGGVGGSGNPPGTWSKSAIAKMSDADYIKNRAAITEAMNTHTLLP